MLTIHYIPNSRAKEAALSDMLKKASADSEKTYWFVPEQQVLEAEKRLVSLGCPRSVEVTSFKRMANSIFRRYGGLCYHYIGKGAKKIVMWRALSSVSPLLQEYSSVSPDDLAVLRLLVATVEEMKLYGVLPEQLEKASKEVEDEKLASKLSDISLLYAAYDTILHEKHDDASDDLWRAAKKADGKGFFESKRVLISSFDGFTKEEVALLNVIFAEAKSIWVTLGYDKDDRRSFFARLHETDRLLRKLAAETFREVKEVAATKVEKKSEIDEFALRIWQNKPKEEPCVFAKEAPEKGGVRLIKCPGVYEEARFVAADIRKKVMQGGRWRDFAIITRDPSRYLGILDAALEGADIPYFLSERKDVTAMPLVRMLFCAFDILNYYWRYEDVIAYLRCALSGLTLEECDEIEEYASTWHISGKRWYDEYGWQMNPEGFSLSFSEKAAEKLVRLNALRERLVAPLIKFFDAFSPSSTVREISRALMYFLQDLKIPERLEKEVTSEDFFFASQSDREEYALLYDCLVSSLDQLVEVAGDLPVTPRAYSRLLMALLSEADIGRLPARFDEVTVGSAELLRKSDIAHVYVIGVGQGEFPASDFSSGCFDNDEREALLLAGIDTAPNHDRRVADEKLFFYRSVTSANSSVTLSYTYRDTEGKESYPSFAFLDTLALFSGREVEDYDTLSQKALLYGSAEIMEYAVNHGYRLQSDRLPEVAEYALLQPMNASKEEIPAALAQTMYRGKISLSQSRSDAFVLCPFAYHCKYTLKLSTKKSGNFEGVDTGNFIHKIFEIFFSRISSRIKTIKDDEAKAILADVMEEYAASIRRSNPGKRFEALVNRLKRTTELLVMNLLAEFRLSDFQPYLFELPINPWGEDSVRSEEIAVSDTQTIAFNGVVDRVDIYRQGQKTYFRVVDYKTGSKEFSMNDVMMGLNMQMLLYLFTLASDVDGSFSQKIQTEGEILPAGVLYFSFAPQKKPKDPALDKRQEDFEKLALECEQRIHRSGVLLNDKEILTAMENTLAGRYLPITVDKDGNCKGQTATSLQTLEELGVLAESIKKTLVAIATELAGGKAAASCEKKGAHDPCAYCQMKPICRMTEKERQDQTQQEEGDEN